MRLDTLGGYAMSMSGYTMNKTDLEKRLKRMEGQVRGLQQMVDDDRYCIDVLTQITAIQAALDKVALGLLDQHARHCMLHGDDGERSDKTDEMMAAVGRFMRRGSVMLTTRRLVHLRAASGSCSSPSQFAPRPTVPCSGRSRELAPTPMR